MDQVKKPHPEKISEQLHVPLDLATIGCWEWDTVADKMIWSADMYTIYAISAGQFAHTYAAFLDLIHPEDRELVAQAINTSLETKQPFNFYHRRIVPGQMATGQTVTGQIELIETIAASDGSMDLPIKFSENVGGETTVHFIHIHGQPLFDQEQQYVRLFGTVQDVSNLKHSETLLVQQGQQLATLTNLGQSALTFHDIEPFYDHVVEQLTQLMPAQHLCLLLAQDDELVSVASNDTTITLASLSLATDEFVTQLAKQPRPVWYYGGDVATTLPAQWVSALSYRPTAIQIAPITMQDEFIGLLIALADHPMRFTTEHQQLLEGAAGWTAIAIANARKYDALKERLEELETIITISRLISATVELEPVLKLIVESAKEMVCRADWAVIHLYHPQQERLVAVSASGLNRSLTEYSINLDEGIIGAVYRSGEFINVADLSEDKRLLPFEEQLGIRSLLVVPLKSQQEFLGTVSVQCSEPGTYAEADERLMVALGLQACVAIRNASTLRELETKHQQLRQLNQRVVTAQEDERRHIARDLHDEVGQILTALRINLALARSDLETVSVTPELQEVHERINGAIELTDSVVKTVRNITYGLRPAALSTSGLNAALEGLCKSFAKRMGITVNYEGVDVLSLTDTQAIMLYRIVQEALTNVVRHASAQEIDVILSLSSATELVICIKDDGCGFVTNSEGTSVMFQETFMTTQEGKHPGTGLSGISERCELLNGRLQIHSTKGEGTEIIVTIPFE